MLGAKLLLCVRLCNPIECSPPGSSVHGIFQARILEWGASSFSRGSSRPRGQTHASYISCFGRQVLYHYRYLVHCFDLLVYRLQDIKKKLKLFLVLFSNTGGFPDGQWQKKSSCNARDSCSLGQKDLLEGK